MLLDATDIDGFVQFMEKHILKFWTKPELSGITKELIKRLEPNKQTKNPYKGGENTKPLWWMSELNHTEPDHLKVHEVSKLLVHLLAVAMFGFAMKHDVTPVTKLHGELFRGSSSLTNSTGVLKSQDHPFSYLGLQMDNRCFPDKVKTHPEHREERERLLKQLWRILEQYQNYCLGLTGSY